MKRVREIGYEAVQLSGLGMIMPLELKRIIDACRKTGVQWYAVEQDICHRDPFESMAISLRNLKAMGLS